MDVPSHSSLPAPWALRLEGEARMRRQAGLERSLRHPCGLDFRSNDYLGLRRDPRLGDAAAQAARDHGWGSGAAPLLGGWSPVHAALEGALARWKGQDSCILFSSGFQLNATLLPALTRAGDALFSDALNHASLVDGCRMARSRGVEVRVFPHRDAAALEQALDHWRRQAPDEALALVATDSVFSMDGDAADLSALEAACRRHGALLMVDEAHASGLLGPGGGGLVEAQGLQGRIPLVMGTLGKALGSSGAFLACPELLRRQVLDTCRGFIFSTALPPPVAAAALEGLRIAQAEPWRGRRALDHAHHLRQALDLPDGPSAIVPLVLGDEWKAMDLASALQDRGFDVRAVRPPSVPPGTARLRITTGAHQDPEDVEALVTAIRACR